MKDDKILHSTGYIKGLGYIAERGC